MSDRRDKSERHRLLNITSPADLASSRRPSWPACDSGPCDRGRKLCPTPHACRLGERGAREWRHTVVVVLFFIAIAAGLAAFFFWSRKP